MWVLSTIGTLIEYAHVYMSVYVIMKSGVTLYVCMFIVGGRGRGVARAERRTESPADLCGEEDTNIYENMREHLRQSLRQDRCGDADNEDEGDIDIE